MAEFNIGHIGRETFETDCTGFLGKGPEFVAIEDSGLRKAGLHLDRLELDTILGHVTEILTNGCPPPECSPVSFRVTRLDEVSLPLPLKLRVSDAENSMTRPRLEALFDDAHTRRAYTLYIVKDISDGVRTEVNARLERIPMEPSRFEIPKNQVLWGLTDFYDRVRPKGQLQGNAIVVRTFPRTWETSDNPEATKIKEHDELLWDYAWAWAHEFGHLQGLRHSVSLKTLNKDGVWADNPNITEEQRNRLMFPEAHDHKTQPTAKLFGPGDCRHFCSAANVDWTTLRQIHTAPVARSAPLPPRKGG